MNHRITQLILVVSFGCYMLLVCFNNLTDYGSNFAFVSHVLSMDDTFPGNAGMWRAIPAPAAHHLLYILIILTECGITVLCFLGAYKMWIHRKGEPGSFEAAKKWAATALTLSFALWFLGFVAIGGEWFLMWQSETWNGIQTAFQNAAVSLLILLILFGKS